MAASDTAEVLAVPAVPLHATQGRTASPRGRGTVTRASLCPRRSRERLCQRRSAPHHREPVSRVGALDSTRCGPWTPRPPRARTHAVLAPLEPPGEGTVQRPGLPVPLLHSPWTLAPHD